MHFAFIPYGVRHEVERVLRALEAEMFPFPMWKGKKKQMIWLSGSVRLLPFGIVEYVFPRECLNLVLHTMMPTGPNRYDVGRARLAVMRKLLKLKPLPKNWDTGGQRLKWIMENVNIIPLGIREDPNTQSGKHTKYAGWHHEAI